MAPWKGALPTLYAAVGDEAEPAGYYGPDGLWTMWGYPAPKKPARISLDLEAAGRLWAASEEAVGLRAPLS